MGGSRIRYFFHAAYQGTRYHGWQKQPEAGSVQETLQHALSTLLKEPITCIGCGRTDAGVHARQYFFHINLSQQLPDNFLFIVNKVLPNDIAIFDILSPPRNGHAQLSATSRTYDYFVHTQKDPFLSELSSYYEVSDWDIAAMQKAIILLPQYDDFRGFCKRPDKHESTVRALSLAQLFSSDAGDKLQFRFRARGFLRGMIRLLVGNLLAVGRGKLSLAEWEDCLIHKKSPRFFNMAHPEGLYLSKITYPFLDLPAKGRFPFELDKTDIHVIPTDV